MQRAFGLDIPQTLKDLCDPQRLALVVYDMQVGIVKQIPDGAQITDKVLQVLEAARRFLGNGWVCSSCGWQWDGNACSQRKTSSPGSCPTPPAFRSSLR